MWDYIINIHQIELLSTKTKESKKKVLHNNFFFKETLTIYILYLIISSQKFLKS